MILEISKRLNLLACLGLFSGLAVSPAASADTDETIKTRPGVTVQLALRDVENPTALILMLPGGPGYLNLDGRGPVAKFYKPLMAQGFSIVAMDVPSDMSNGLSPRDRAKPEHLRDLKSIIAYLRKAFLSKLWVWGISRGSLSAGHLAAAAVSGVSGYIFLSSPTRLPRRANVSGVAGLALDRIKAPVLAIGHEDDECRGTPAQGARRIVRNAINSQNAKAKLFSGGATFGGNPCGPGTAHTFNGIEDQVAREIAAFIKAN